MNIRQAHINNIYAAKRGSRNTAEPRLPQLPIAEAVELKALSNWFNQVYDQLSDKIDAANRAGKKQLEIKLREVRATLKDYEPRMGQTSDEATNQMEQLYRDLEDTTVGMNGHMKDYLRQLKNSVKSVALDGVNAESGMDDMGGDNIDSDGESGLGGISGIDNPDAAGFDDPGAEADFPEGEFPEPADGPIDVGGDAPDDDAPTDEPADDEVPEESLKSDGDLLVESANDEVQAVSGRLKSFFQGWEKHISEKCSAHGENPVAVELTSRYNKGGDLVSGLRISGNCADSDMLSEVSGQLDDLVNELATSYTQVSDDIDLEISESPMWYTFGVTLKNPLTGKDIAIFERGSFIAESRGVYRLRK